MNREDIKFAITIIIGILGLAFFFYYFVVDKIAVKELAGLMVAHGVFLILFYHFDRIERLIIENRFFKLLVTMRNEIKEARMRIASPPSDLNISVEDRARVNEIVKAEALKLEVVINGVEVLVNKAEEELKGRKR